VWAVGNPAQKNRRGRLNTLHDKSSGFGIVRFNKPDQTVTMECYRLQVDAANLDAQDQFPGWPLTIKMTDNYARKPYGFLDEIVWAGGANPVVKVIDERSDALVYALRIQGKRFRPWVFEKGTYRIEIGEPEMDNWKTVAGQVVR
jgi:hypothetical protein